MASRLKVYGGWIIRPNVGSSPQCKVVVAAKSRAEVARLLDVGIRHVTNFMSETGNAKDIEVAMSEPGTVFLRPMDPSPDPNDAGWKPEGEWT
jgi:hypothetical protein